MVKIITPGHNPITDSLIMWGIVYLTEDCKGRVEGKGGRYEIFIEGECDLEKNFRKRFENKIIENPSKKKGRFDLSEEERVRNDIDPDMRTGVAESIFYVLNEIDKGVRFEDIFTFDHFEKFQEGRFGRGKILKTLYIPLSGVYGKYQLMEFKAKDKPYRACYFCISLAYLGFATSASIVRIGKTERLYSIIGFEGEVDLDGLRTLLNPIWFIASQDLLSRAYRSKKKTPALSPFAISLIYTTRMEPAARRVIGKASWYMGMIGYETGGLKRITKFDIVELTSISNFVEDVIKIYPYLPELIENLLDSIAIENDSDVAINILSEIAFNRRLELIYSFLRNLKVLLKRLEGDQRQARARQLRNRISRNITSKLGEALIFTL